MNLAVSEEPPLQCDFCGTPHSPRVIIVEGPHIQIQFCSRCALLIGGAGLATFDSLEEED